MFKIERQKVDRRQYLIPFFILLVPFILFFGVRSDAPNEGLKKVNNNTNVQRIVIVVVDALRKSNVEEDMPKLRELSRDALYLPIDTCLANFTLPCIQTLLEGRETSPVAAIHNFTGSKSNQSILSILSKKKWRIETYSDHTAGALFSEVSDRTENLDTYSGDLLQKDLKLIEKAKTSLQEKRERQILVLHVPGTDKKVHGSPIGGKDYRDHFGAVDSALGDLIDTLDFEQDLLFISGDHGHNDKGFHETESVAILKAPTFFELDKVQAARIAAVDLLFWLSFATNSELSNDYEGRSFWLSEDDLIPQKREFQSREEARLRAQQFAGNSMGDLLQSQEETNRKKTIISTINVLSILILILALLLAVLFPNPRWKGRDIIGLGIAVILSFGFFVDLQLQLFAVSFRLLLFATALFFLFFERLKVGALTVALFTLSLFTAYFDTSIHDHFREGDGGDFILIIYGTATLLSVLAGLFFFPGVLVSEEDDAKLDAEGKKKLADLRSTFRISVVGFSGLLGMLALGSGGYFYSSSTNYFNMFFFVGGIVLFGYAAIHYLENKTIPHIQTFQRHFVHVLLFLSIAILLQFTDQFNWRWIFLPTIFLKNQPIISHVLIVGSILYLWWSAKDKQAYYFLFLPLVLVSFVYTKWAGITSASYAVSLLPSVLFVSFFSLRDAIASTSSTSSNSTPNRKGIEEGFEALLLYCALYATTWIGMDGFDIANIDFTYFDKYFPEIVNNLSTDSERLIFYAPLTIPKYLLTPLFPLSIYFVMRGFRPRIVLYSLSFFLVQMLFLVGDVVFSISAGSVLAGAAVDDMLFVWLISIAVSVILVLGLTIEKVKSRSKKNEGEGTKS